MAETRYWRAAGIALGLGPDADPADILLVSRNAEGILQPARAVEAEYQRTWRWLQDERAARQQERSRLDAPA